MNGRGWWLTLNASNAAEAHYVEGAAGALCGAAEAPLSRWEVAAHVGRVALCERCKDGLRTAAARAAP